MSYQETVRWIFNNVKALLGRFEYIDRPKGSVPLYNRDLTVALFTKELVDLFDFAEAEKVQTCLTILEELYGNESGGKLYKIAILKAEPMPSIDRTKDDLAIAEVISWFKSERMQGYWPFIFHFSKNLIDNPLVVSVVNNGAINEKTDLFLLHSKLRSLRNKWMGNFCAESTYELKSLRFLLKIILSDIYPKAINKNSDYFDARQIPFVAQALCVWWLMPAYKEYSVQETLVQDFLSLWQCLWVNPEVNNYENIQLAGQYIFNPENVLFCEPEMQELVNHLDVFLKVERVDISNPSSYSLRKLETIQSQIIRVCKK